MLTADGRTEVCAEAFATAMNEPVDVLIIGAGASGAAVAWSLAETKMRILCLEQGDWADPAKFPSTGRDWEARQMGPQPEPEPARLAGGLSDQRGGLADQGGEL